MSLFTVEIESLVLEGFDLSPSEGRRLARLTESALARLVERRSVAFRMTSRMMQEAPQQIEVEPGTRRECLAEQIAAALYRALDRMS
jgi:hypothetical protein